MMKRVAFEGGNTKPEIGTRLYTCNGCGKTGPWGKGWRWFGTWRDMDNLGVGGIAIACSPECQEAAHAKYMPHKYRRQ